MKIELKPNPFTARKKRVKPKTKTKESSMAMAKRRKRRKTTAKKRTRRRRNYWTNNAAGHRKAALKGWRKRKRKPTRRKAAKRKTTRKRRRKNPASSYAPYTRKRRTYRKKVARRNPRRRYRRRRRNPKLTLNKFFNRKLVMKGVTVGGGIALGSIMLPLASRIVPEAQRSQYSQYMGVLNLVVGSLMVGFLKNKMAKDMGVIVAGTGIYDLVQQNLVQDLPSIRADVVANQITSAMGLGCSYGGVLEMKHAGSSYAVARPPVSPVSRAGVLGSSYDSVPAGYYGSSYQAPGMMTEGLMGTDPYEGVDW